MNFLLWLLGLFALAAALIMAAHNPGFLLLVLASVLGRFEEAETYFAEAADLNHRGDMAYSSAMTDLAWGEMVATRDADTDRGRAQDLLTSSLTIALDHGYAGVERQARAALASCS